MTVDVSVRPATADDADAIQRVARDAWHAAYDPVTGAGRVDETVDSWYDPERLVADDVQPADRPFFPAAVDGTVVDFVEVAPDGSDDALARLFGLYVAPDYWGQGIGSSFLDRAERVLREGGFDRLRLTVLADNGVGVGFYKSSGFERTASTHDDRFDVREYEYEKRL